MSTSLKKQEAGQASYIVAQDWAETYADALTAFNADQLNRTLFASFATTHREDQPVLFEELCAVLISLIDRKVIVP